MTAYTRMNALDQALDIAGSLSHDATKTLTEEAAGLGRLRVSGAATASFSAPVSGSGLQTISGLSGMTSDMIGGFLTIAGALTGSNNGTNLLAEYVSSTSVKWINAGGSAEIGSVVTFNERDPYTLNDDLDFERTDRAAIKGVAYTAAVPTYQRPDAVGTNVPANLNNIASKTTDAKAFVINREYIGLAVLSGSSFSILSGTTEYKHADSVDTTGVPVIDGYDAGDYVSVYVQVFDPSNSAELNVLSGSNVGDRIIGFTAASGSVSPSSVTVLWKSVNHTASLSTAIPYSWEAGQPNTVNLFYGFRERLDNLDEDAFRKILTNGTAQDASLLQYINNLDQVVGVTNTDTSLAGLLTNTGTYFPFFNLPDATPSVVEAFNTLNSQIGNRTYAGPGNTILNVDGETITASLQKLADAVSSASAVRTIERLAADVPAGSSYLIPVTYTLDGTGNGRHLWVFWRGLLRHPGTLASFAGNEYEETDTTHITPHQKIKAGDIIDYFKA